MALCLPVVEVQGLAPALDMMAALEEVGVSPSMRK
jgi:hypothetical protein